MSNTESVYKEALNELIESLEKIEPVIQRAKQLHKSINQDEYIELMEEQNRILKERIKQLEDVASPQQVYPLPVETFSYNGCPMSWNSLVMFILCAWIFLVFLGF